MPYTKSASRRTRDAACAALVIGSGLAAPIARAGADAAIEANSLHEVVVLAQRYEFLSVDTSGATNLPLAIEQVPQSISLVSSDFIKAADLKTLGDIAEYTPGAISAGNSEGFGTMIKLRGFPAAQALDGVNVGVLSGVTFEPEYAVVDRLEIVKGPSSVIYGVSSAGGLVNFVTKSATANTPDYVSLEAGSWNNYRFVGQVAGAVDAAKNIRAIGIVVRDQGDSFMTDVSHSSSVVYGGLDWTGARGFKGYLHGGFEQHVRTSLDGIPTEADGSPAPLPRAFFIGAKGMELKTGVLHAEGGLSWRATDMLDVSLKANMRNSHTHGTAPYSFGLDSGGNLGIAIQDFQSYNGDGYGVELSGTYRFDALGLKDSFLSLSALYQHDISHLAQGQGAFSGAYAGPDPTDPSVGTVNLSGGQSGIEAAFNSAVLTGTNSVSDIASRTLTVSAQSVIRVVEHLSLLAGASWAKPHITNSTDGTYQDYSSGNQASYRAGLIYELTAGTNAYLSFSQSFNPQTLIDVNGNVLPPVVGEQYEGGVKYRSPNGRLLLTAALFQITQKNQGQFDTQVNGLDRYAAIGELKHKGLELEAVGRLSRAWQVNAGYTALDPKVSRDSEPTTIGQTELYLPKQTASLFTTYTIEDGGLKGLSIGGGARYIGAVRTAFDGSTREIPAYEVVDATVGYTLDAWNIQLNLRNILDKHYYINNYGTLFYGNSVGMPFNAALTVRRFF